MNIALRAVTAVASIVAGVLHWDIWAHHGYRSAPVREMFVASAALGVALGLLAFVNRRRAAVPAAVASAVFLAAFALSRLDEVPTFHGGWSDAGLAPQDASVLGVSTTLLLVVAEVAAVLCGLASLLFRRQPRPAALSVAYARA